MNVRLLLLSLVVMTLPLTANAAPSGAVPQSAAHSLAAVDGVQSASPNGGQTPHFLPISLVWQDGKRAFFSSAVNAVSAEARIGEQEWLATAMGVKRIDLASRQVRHYTRLDGLPGDRVTAIAAAGPEAVYCVCEAARAGGSVLAVCRFVAATGRWTVEQEVPRPDYETYRRAIPAGQGLSSSVMLAALGYWPLDNVRALLAVSHGRVCFAPDVSLSAANPLLFLRRPNSSAWRAVTPGPALRAGIGPLQIFSLHMTDDGTVWLGTSQGLWRYAPAQDKWTYFLNDALILLSALRGGDVWAVTSSPPPAVLSPTALRQPSPPSLVRLNGVTGETQTWPFPPDASKFNSWAARPATLAVGDDGRVWACEGDATLDPGSRFCVFDPATKQWQSVPSDSTAGLASVPDGALPLPLLATIAPAREYMRRFPEWFCPDEPGPAVPYHTGQGPTFWMDQNIGHSSEADRYQPISSEPNSRYATQLTDPGGVTWNLGHTADGDYALIRTGPRSTGAAVGRQVFPWPGAHIQTNPPIATLGSVGGILLVSTVDASKYWAVNPTRGTWAATGLWSNGQYGVQQGIITQGGHSWIWDTRAVVRCDPKTRLTSPRFEFKNLLPQDEPSLLAVTGAGRLWLVIENMRNLPWRRLYRVESGSNALVEIPLTLPPALRPPRRYSQGYVNDILENTPLPTTPDAVAVSETPIGDIVWCTGWMTLQGKQVVCLIGYNSKTRRWTTPQPAGWGGGNLHPITLGSKVFLPVPGEAAAVWEYETRTGQWGVAAKPFQGAPGFGTNALPLISVSPDVIWCLDAQMLRVCRYDRRKEVWSIFPCPIPYAANTRMDKVARVGDALFLASREGLWRFDMRGHTWCRLPEPGYEKVIEYITGDAKSIWGKTKQGVVRFDKAERRWTTYNRPDDTLERFVSNEMASDSGGAWLYDNSPAYRLDLATGRWSDMTRGALADPNLSLFVTDIVADGQWVWLLPGSVRGRLNEMKEASEPLLGRYDVTTGRMDWLNRPGTPVGSVSSQPTMMLVEQDAVWVGTQGGMYRYDKATQSLSRFQVPPQYPVPSDFAPNTAVRDGDALWLLGWPARLRWVP